MNGTGNGTPTSDVKKILIISPHFPPSNLVGAHRARLFGIHLPAFGWEPVILTVDEKYYEETPDYHLNRLVPAGLRVEKASAFPVTRPRLVGDIGLRGFLGLYRKGKELIREEKIDFLLVTIPSFYAALLGRWLHARTGVPYGIDYQDPWVHHFPGSDRLFSRHWFSSRLAGWLEPIAVKKARLIIGVAEGYYKGVLDRNPRLRDLALSGAMPIGGEKADHEKVAELDLRPYLFSKTPGKLRLMYAGAMLPKAYGPLEAILDAISRNAAVFEDLEIYFVGTGKTPDDPEGYNVRPLAQKYGLWNKVIFEHPRRIPYLEVLVHLEAVDGVFILGSTEPHYTPSKVYQGVLSRKPIFAVLHQASSAVQVIRSANTGVVLAYDGESEVDRIGREFVENFERYKSFIRNFDPRQVDMKAFDAYSAREVTAALAGLLDKL
jgi:hypothetical protein